MVNLPKHSLRVVYEFVFSLRGKRLDEALAVLNAPVSDVRSFDASIVWYTTAYTYNIFPHTEEWKADSVVQLRCDQIQMHYQMMEARTKDIRSYIIYRDPVTGERHQLDGDWVQAKMTNQPAASDVDERFLHC